jgi:HSP20 family protein
MFEALSRSYFDPFREMRRLQGDMNQLFDETAYGYQPVAFPAINIWSNKDNVFIVAELPGIDKDSLNISVENEEIVISGERKESPPAEDVYCHRCERFGGKFYRSEVLPFKVAADKVSAKLSGGVLTIVLPRVEADKPKKIAITE